MHMYYTYIYIYTHVYVLTFIYLKTAQLRRRIERPPRDIPHKKFEIQKIKPQPINKPWISSTKQIPLYKTYCIMNIVF